MELGNANQISDAIAAFAKNRQKQQIVADGDRIRIPVNDKIMADERQQDEIANCLTRMMAVSWIKAEKKDSGYRYKLSENNDWWAKFEDGHLVVQHRYGNMAVLGSLAILICYRCGLGNKTESAF